MENPHLFNSTIGEGSTTGENLGLGSWMVMEKQTKRVPRHRQSDPGPRTQRPFPNRYMILHDEENVTEELPTLTNLDYAKAQQGGFNFIVGNGSTRKGTERQATKLEVHKRPKGPARSVIKNNHTEPVNTHEATGTHTSRRERSLGASRQPVIAPPLQSTTTVETYMIQHVELGILLTNFGKFL
ncbi:hypothetical protein K2173_004635 [Erythroxylum novogranatense]|uniref:Uncharacterized protein n=1 Tax=Erythroxylum novogranatense TaxID=1862640 RepID=A0AAV8SXS2_9ROSI|nr:hypothetical protein K2173_004635 [Erythroxylum novogranatense]